MPPTRSSRNNRTSPLTALKLITPPLGARWRRRIEWRRLGDLDWLRLTVVPDSSTLAVWSGLTALLVSDERRGRELDRTVIKSVNHSPRLTARGVFNGEVTVARCGYIRPHSPPTRVAALSHLCTSRLLLIASGPLLEYFILGCASFERGATFADGLLRARLRDVTVHCVGGGGCAGHRGRGRAGSGLAPALRLWGVGTGWSLAVGGGTGIVAVLLARWETS